MISDKIKVGVTIYNDKGIVEFESVIIDNGDDIKFMFIKLNTYYYDKILKLYHKPEKYNPISKIKDIVELLEWIKYNGIILEYKILEDDNG